MQKIQLYQFGSGLSKMSVSESLTEDRKKLDESQRKTEEDSDEE